MTEKRHFPIWSTTRPINSPNTMQRYDKSLECNFWYHKHKNTAIFVAAKKNERIYKLMFLTRLNHTTPHHTKTKNTRKEWKITQTSYLKNHPWSYEHNISSKFLSSKWIAVGIYVFLDFILCCSFVFIFFHIHYLCNKKSLHQSQARPFCLFDRIFFEANCNAVTTLVDFLI